MTTTTNIDGLLDHLKRNVYGKALVTTEFKNALHVASKKMEEKVVKRVERGSGKLDYKQSRQFLNVLKGGQDGTAVSKSKARAGFGQIDSLNQSTLRRAQSGTFFGGKVIKLTPEKDLPSWIIMEFGRKGSVEGRPRVPSFIKKEIKYSSREKKELTFGPSESRHRAKPIFFQTSDKMLAEHHDISKKEIKSHPFIRKHPGIREGKFFRDGLRESFPEVAEIIGKGLVDSINSISRSYGGGTVMR